MRRSARLGLVWILTVAWGGSARGQEAPVNGEAAERARCWAHLAGRVFFDAEAFAGARYAFFNDDAGQPAARYTLLGSGVPVIAEGAVEVVVRGDLVTLGRLDPAAHADEAPASGSRRFRYDARADVLRAEGRCGIRLVPCDDAGAPLTSPLLTRLKIAPADAVDVALTHEDSLVRREALVAVAEQRGTTYRAGFPEVVQLLGDDVEAAVRATAAWAAGQCQEEAAVPRLVELLGSDDVAVRREAAGALGWGKLGGEAAIAPLRALLERETDPGVRAYAERALEILTSR